MKFKPLIALAILSLCSSPLMAETGYIQARKAKIMAAPAIKADVVAIAMKGDTIEIIETQGRWLNVKFGGQQGWVSKLLVSNKPPLNKITILNNGNDTDLSKTARRRASISTSAAATRGLRSENRARQSDETVADFSAIREMEAHKISEDEALDFLEQGNDK